MKKIAILFFLVISLGYSYSQNFNYDIKFHRLNIEVDPSVRYIKGEITTYFCPIKMAMTTISFNLKDQMQVDSISFRNQEITFTRQNDILTANLGTSLAIGILDSIFVYYHGNPPDDGFGSFINEKHNGTPVLWTLSEPMGSQTWWPSKIALNDKADSIEMIVTAPIQYSVASNGIIEKIDTLPGDLKRTTWKHRYPITAYLVAFAVTNYSSYYDYVNIGDTINLPILEMVYPENLSSAKLETPNVIDVLQFYCDSFMLYPYWKEKYGQAQFNWGGGMEHQTMTFLVNFDHELMAHELAHQWFGDYITCGSWHDIWLNEGFAVYLEGLTAEKGLAPYSWEEWKSETISYATYLTNGSVYVDDTTNVDRIFNYRLTYMKGGILLHMLRWVLGDEAFFNGIRNYLHDPKLAYGYATIDDLKTHLETAGDTSLTEFFNDWYYGQGFPIYKITWKKEIDNNITITIKQNKSSTNSPFFEMILPIELVGVNGEKEIIKLNNTLAEQSCTIKSNFEVKSIIFDPDKWILTRNAIAYEIIDTSKLTFSMFPNPAGPELNISFPKTIKVNSFEIYDTLGKIVSTTYINAFDINFKLNCKNLKKGTYILKINTDEQIFSKKFIKQ